MLTAEWKPKGKIYLIEVESDKRNKTTFSAPTWVKNDSVLLQWVKDRIADKTIPAFGELRIVKPITDVIHKLN
jgi:hypothetical protein